MKAIQIARYGGAEELRLADVPVPEPGEGEALVKLAFAGVNFIDVYMRQGVYRKLETYKNVPPFVLGMEGAGTVAKVGPDVTNVAVGERVAYCLSLGGYAEYAADQAVGQIGRAHV